MLLLCVPCCNESRCLKLKGRNPRTYRRLKLTWVNENIRRRVRWIHTRYNISKQQFKHKRCALFPGLTIQYYWKYSCIFHSLISPLENYSQQQREFFNTEHLLLEFYTGVHKRRQWQPPLIVSRFRQKASAKWHVTSPHSSSLKRENYHCHTCTRLPIRFLLHSSAWNTVYDSAPQRKAVKTIKTCKRIP